MKRRLIGFGGSFDVECRLVEAVGCTLSCLSGHEAVTDVGIAGVGTTMVPPPCLHACAISRRSRFPFKESQSQPIKRAAGYEHAPLAERCRFGNIFRPCARAFSVQADFYLCQV